MALLGKRNILTAVRESGPGLYLDGGDLGEILLPGRYIPNGFAPKDNLDVFVYLDSEDRLVATTEVPLAVVGDIACLKVVSVSDRAGAFLDWGLSKDLLLPFREQAYPVHAGQSVVVMVCIDSKSGRIMASTRFEKHLSQEPPVYRSGQSVNLIVTGRTPLGFNAIIEKSHFGLLYHDKLNVPLAIGQKIKGFVRGITPSGKIDLSLDPSGYKRVAGASDKILEALQKNRGRLNFDDDSPPAAIRLAFGISKKAFKQALGQLYKLEKIRFLNPGIELLDNSSWSPKASPYPRRK